VRVVVYHTFGFAWIGFLFPSMGVMFALAGSLVARSLDRTTGARVVHNRVRRLLPSLWLLGVVLIPAMLLHGWPTDTGERPLVWYELLYWIFPIADPPGNDWAVDGTGVLWYVRAYLWFVLLSPFLLRLFRRAPVATTLAPLLLVVAYTIGALDLDERGLAGTGLVDLGTYGTCWLLGFAHHTGAIRRMKLPVLLGLAATAVIFGGAWAATHPAVETGFDLNEIPLAQALWSVGAVLMLLRPSPRLDWLDRLPALRRLVTVLNTRALTI